MAVKARSRHLCSSRGQLQTHIKARANFRHTGSCRGPGWLVSPVVPVSDWTKSQI